MKVKSWLHIKLSRLIFACCFIFIVLYFCCCLDSRKRFNNAALRYVTAACHLVRLRPEVNDELIKKLNIDNTQKYSQATIMYLNSESTIRALHFLMLGDKLKVCNFIPDNNGIIEYQMPPVPSLEDLGLVACNRALMLHLKGNTSKAVDILMATFRFGQRVGSVGLLLTRIAGYRIQKNVFEVFNRILLESKNKELKGEIISFVKSLKHPIMNVSEQILLYKKHLLATLIAAKKNPGLLMKFHLERNIEFKENKSVMRVLNSQNYPLKEQLKAFVDDSDYDEKVREFAGYLNSLASHKIMTDKNHYDIEVLCNQSFYMDNIFVKRFTGDFKKTFEMQYKLENMCLGLLKKNKK